MQPIDDLGEECPKMIIIVAKFAISSPKFATV